MSDLKIEKIEQAGLNIGYDIVFESGRLKIVDGIDEIKNRILMGLNIYRGECFTNPEFGVDYFNNVYGRDITDTILQDALKLGISGNRGVVSIDSFTVLSDGRTANIAANIKTNSGQLQIVTPIQT